ncbi:MAG TPA: hypothetical protein VFI56_03590 [Vicinamibacterales bacterium]|jgi:hypothetical protein|nr:hypothetical protein [Vicinamibacterales bacterium]
MKRTALFILSVLAVSSNPSAQAPADAIATALLGLPANVREGATVIKWKPDQTYDTLQKGTNGLVCYDRSGFPLQQPFSIECTSMGNLPRVAQNMKAEATGDKAKSEAMLKAAEENGTRVKPEFGSVFYHMAGPDKEHARAHMTISVPGATAQSMGLPDKRTQNSIWIMNAGTSTAHLMVPGE